MEGLIGSSCLLQHANQRPGRSCQSFRSNPVACWRPLSVHRFRIWGPSRWQSCLPSCHLPSQSPSHHLFLALHLLKFVIFSCHVGPSVCQYSTSTCFNWISPHPLLTKWSTFFSPAWEICPFPLTDRRKVNALWSLALRSRRSRQFGSSRQTFCHSWTPSGWYLGKICCMSRSHERRRGWE